MSPKDERDSIFEEVDPSEQTIRIVKDTKKESKVEKNEEEPIEETPSKSIHVVEVEPREEENIPFEPTRELKVQRTDNFKESNEYKERVIVNSSEENVGVKKIIIGEETTTLPVYKKPKKDPQIIIRDIFIYLLMVAIVSILVILLLKYCNDAKNDKRTIIDVDPTSSTTTKLTTRIPSTETTTTISTKTANTEKVTSSTSKKPGLQMPTSKKTSKKTTTKAVTPAPPTSPTEKPTDPVPETPTEPTPEQPTEPTTPPSTEPSDTTEGNEQG